MSLSWRSPRGVFPSPSRLQRKTVYYCVRDPVYAVGLWYGNYPPISDDDACRMLHRTVVTVRLARPTAASDEHRRELGAEATPLGEERFEERGFPPRGLDIGETAYPSPAPATAGSYRIWR